MTQHTHAWRVRRTGGPEVMTWEQVELPEPAPGEVTLRHTAIGFNFTDVYHRDGRYPVPLPTGLGNEAAGVVEAVGAGVTALRPGDRVGYLTGKVRDAYSLRRNVPADLLVRLPESVDDATAAAILIKGVTTHYLFTDVRPIRAGESVLIHAAAGGVGLIACQWAKALGARVIGTASTEQKAALAREHGCDHVIISSREDVAAEVRRLTGGQGVPVVYDSVGKDTFAASLDALATRGHLVSFGSASGVPAPVDIRSLSAKGSLTVTRCTLVDFTRTPQEIRTRTDAVFEAVRSGTVKVLIGARFGLSEAPAVHVAAQSRQTTGSVVMLPDGSPTSVGASP
jgi:NADPH:quinone reductase